VVKALESIKIPVVVVSIDTDRLFPPRLQVEVAELVPGAAALITISSDFGHDGFLVESEAVGVAIRKALSII
jgi:homoserine O-acetyltransferase